MSKILTIMPTRGILFVKAQEALEREFADIKQVPSIVRTDGVPLPDSRNLLVESAMAATWWDQLLFLDDDIILPEGALKAMQQALLDNNADIAVIDYPHHRHHIINKDRKYFGVAVYDQWLEGEKIAGKKVAWAGMGCVLVRRSAMRKLYAHKPLFQGTAHPLVRTKDGTIKMGIRHDQPQTSTGEDIHFFFLARKLGLKVVMVPDLICGHARIEKFVYRLAGGQYTNSHEIAVNERIDVPSNDQYPLDEKS